VSTRSGGETMKKINDIFTIIGLVVLLMLVLFAAGASAQSTEFTYQGRLLDNTLPPTANYDFEFSLWDALANGTQQGTTQTVTGVAVANGIFTVRLNFGAQFDGAARFLQINVRPSLPPGGTFTTLAPRQPLTSAPYSIRSSNAASANSISCTLCITDGHIVSIDGAKVTGTVANATNAINATNATTATTAGNVTGVVAITNGGTGSSTQNFVDLSNDQTSIGGNKIFTGTLTANIVAATQFNTGSTRVFKYEFATANTYAGFHGNPVQSGTDNSFFGNLAGLGNTGSRNSFFGSNAARFVNAASDNSFFGANSGQRNTSGQFNSFFGSGTGLLNQTGSFNSFFGFRTGQSSTGTANTFLGANAGLDNTEGRSNTFIGNSAGLFNTLGQYNTFIGDNIGQGNTIGNYNTLLGTSANVGSNDLTFATAIGSGSVVSTSNTVILGRSGGQDTVVIPGTLAANLQQYASTVYSTGSLTVTPTTPCTQIPGLTQTFSVPANQSVFVSAGGGINTQAPSDPGFSIVDIQLRVDGVQVSNGGLRRIVISHNGIGQNLVYWEMTHVLPLSVTAHTISVVTCGFGGSNAIVAGNNTSILQSSLSVITIKN